MTCPAASCRERQRQNLQNLQNKQSDYADTVEKLEQVNLSNRDLEVEKQRLEAELNELNGLQHIRPSAPAASNGYSDSDSNHSSNQAVFTTRVGRNITVKPAHAVKYRKTEQAWFAKVTILPMSSFSALKNMLFHMRLFMRQYTMRTGTVWQLCTLLPSAFCWSASG